MADRPAPTAVALFGGSFNPPHLAHQMACLVALETAPVDAVWLLPTWRHAFAKPLAPFADRLEMCRLAARVFGGRVEVDPIEEELGRAGGEAPTRTYDTVVALRARHPGTSFRLVVGADILAERDAWHRWDDLVALAPLLVVGRAGAAPAARGTVALPAISSSEVRARLARGEDAAGLVPREVMDYIAERGLYR